ncbi:MAG TPA: hypothetical protein VGI00_08095 [Streptosporangiaceae bacterium]|jgi:hypothetical protein
MNVAITWALFAGSWLLVAGPLYQAAIELNEMDVDREGFAAIASQLPRPKMPSPWWWLLPPVMYLLARHASEQNQRAIFAEMSETQRNQFISFRSKAAGWLTVALGATLLAIAETWDIVEHYDWPQWVFWVLIVFAMALAVVNTAARMIGSDRALRDAAAALAESS